MIRVCVTPVGKPRMVKSDAWRGRECVTKYWIYKDELQRALPDYIINGTLKADFFLPMPKSWSKAKRSQNAGRPHQQKPDLDNICKGFLDCLCTSDAHVYELTIGKYWDHEGHIDIWEGEDNA
jgi:Holliday junction resolvase RusA-like endonuclease